MRRQSAVGFGHAPDIVLKLVQNVPCRHLLAAETVRRRSRVRFCSFRQDTLSKTILNVSSAGASWRDRRVDAAGTARSASRPTHRHVCQSRRGRWPDRRARPRCTPDASHASQSARSFRERPFIARNELLRSVRPAPPRPATPRRGGIGGGVTPERDVFRRGLPDPAGDALASVRHCVLESQSKSRTLRSTLHPCQSSGSRTSHAEQHEEYGNTPTERLGP